MCVYLCIYNSHATHVPSAASLICPVRGYTHTRVESCCNLLCHSVPFMRTHSAPYGAPLQQQQLSSGRRTQVQKRLRFLRVIEYVVKPGVTRHRTKHITLHIFREFLVVLFFFFSFLTSSTTCFFVWSRTEIQFFSDAFLVLVTDEKKSSKPVAELQ